MFSIVYSKIPREAMSFITFFIHELGGCDCIIIQKDAEEN